MSYLTGAKIITHVTHGDIVIDPFNPSFVGPNSVDLRLADDLYVYDMNRAKYVAEVGSYLDMCEGSEAPPLIPAPRQPDGSYFLCPGTLYLGRTIERVGSRKCVPTIEGRSSVGRFGVQVHMTAGVGDLGFFGTFTLEIAVTHPVRLVPGGRICQVLFSTVDGNRARQYEGRYQGQVDPTPSRYNLPGFLPSGE